MEGFDARLKVVAQDLIPRRQRRRGKGLELHGAGLRDNTLEGVASADVDARMGDCDICIRWKFKMPRLEVLTSPGDQRWLGPPKEGTVRTEFCREGLAFFIAEVQSEQRIEQTQHARPVRTSSA